MRRGRGCASVVWQTLKSPLPPHFPSAPLLSSPNQYTSCFYPWLLWCLSLSMGVTECPEGQTHTQTSRGPPHPHAHCCPASPLLWGSRAEAPEHFRHTEDPLVAGRERLRGKPCPPPAGLCPHGRPSESQSLKDGLAFLPPFSQHVPDSLLSAGALSIDRDRDRVWGSWDKDEQGGGCGSRTGQQD